MSCKKETLRANLIIKEEPPDYKTLIVKKYYDYMAKYNSYSLFHFQNKKRRELRIENNVINIYIEQILNTYFKELEFIKSLVLIDLTYTPGSIKYIKNRLKTVYEIISKFLLRKKVFTQFEISILLNPKYKLLTSNNNSSYHDILEEILNEEKKEFVYMSGTLEYFMIKSISYYSEQIFHILFFIQIFYLLSIQKKGGAFIFFCYSIDSKISRDFIKLLNNYYDEVILFKLPKISANIMFIIGKKFLSISNNDLKILSDVYKDILDKYGNSYGDNLNVFNAKLRKKHSIVKYIVNFSTNFFIHNIYDINLENRTIDKKITEFNKKIFTEMYDNYKKKYDVVPNIIW